jgi:signal transduction histidine kinase
MTSRNPFGASWHIHNSSSPGLKAEHSSQTKKYLENIARDGARLNSLVSDLREYPKIWSGAKPFAQTGMEEIFAKALKTLHREVRETRASIMHGSRYADGSLSGRGTDVGGVWRLEMVRLFILLCLSTLTKLLSRK